MRTIVVDVFLFLAVAAAWLGCLGFLRVGTALGGLHCVSFVVIAGGSCLTIAAVAQDGLTTRSEKTIALLVFLLAISSAASHALGSAIYGRDGRNA